MAASIENYLWIFGNREWVKGMLRRFKSL
uniref:Transposase n=1 Tax=Heterorhabditis bacteriophora TaxID=37862 RepID=A0A1I7WEE0_HETBA